MKISVCFVRVNGKDQYNEGARRWLDSYLEHRPEMQHEVVIINRYQNAEFDPNDPFLIFNQTLYTGGGWDCGAWKFAGQNIPADLLICFNSSTRIMCDGWMERIVSAVDANGDGIYGPLTSLEIEPHVRTPCMAFQPHVINEYPQEVPDRESTYRFESMGYPDGTPNFTLWGRSKGYQTRLVTCDGDYDIGMWRMPPNIFRRGDQSNLLVMDRHCDAYAASNAENKARLERLADGVK
jgi:hypothetical protein